MVRFNLSGRYFSRIQTALVVLSLTNNWLGTEILVSGITRGPNDTALIISLWTETSVITRGGCYLKRIILVADPGGEMGHPTGTRRLGRNAMSSAVYNQPRHIGKNQKKDIKFFNLLGKAKQAPAIIACFWRHLQVTFFPKKKEKPRNCDHS